MTEYEPSDITDDEVIGVSRAQLMKQRLRNNWIVISLVFIVASVMGIQFQVLAGQSKQIDEFERQRIVGEERDEVLSRLEELGKDTKRLVTFAVEASSPERQQELVDTLKAVLRDADCDGRDREFELARLLEESGVIPEGTSAAYDRCTPEERAAEGVN